MTMPVGTLSTHVAALNLSSQIRFQANPQIKPPQNAVEDTVSVGTSKPAHDAGKPQTVLADNTLGPILKKQWHALGPEQRRFSTYLMHDISTFLAYENRPTWLKKLQQWTYYDRTNNRPALVAFRDNLKKTLPLAEPKTALDNRMLAAFDQYFLKLISALKINLAELSRYQGPNSLNADRKALLKSLNRAAQWQDAPLESDHLYSALFQGAVAMKQAKTPHDDVLMHFGRLFLKAPERITQKYVRDRVVVPEPAFKPKAKKLDKAEPSKKETPVNPEKAVVTKSMVPALEFMNLEAADAVYHRIYRFERAPRPGFILGHVDDQRSLIAQMAVNPQMDKDVNGQANVHSFVIESDFDEAFHHQWEGLQVNTRTTFSYMSAEKPDVLKALKKTMSEIQQKTPIGKNALLFILADESQVPLFNQLGRLAKAFPNVKLVVGGMEALAANIDGGIQDSAAIIKLKPPTLSEALMNFRLSGQSLREDLEKEYKVRFEDDAVTMIAKTLMQSSGRAPSRDHMISMMDKVASQAAKKAQALNQGAEGRHQDEGVFVITSDFVTQFDSQRQSYIQDLLSATGGKDGKGFKFKPDPTLKLDAVVGQEEAVTELRTLAALARSSQLRQELRQKKNIRIDMPKLMSFVGDPGTGKTFTARAFANEVGVNFIPLSAVELRKMYLGEGAQKVRDIFRDAYENGPSIIFLDEVDSVAQQRVGASDGGQEVESTLNQILVELDGFAEREGVTTIVSTNMPELLDKALKSRQIKQVRFKAPNLEQKTQILAQHAKRSGYPFSPDIQFETVAKKAEGFVGRDLAMLLQRAINKTLAPMASLLEEYSQHAEPDLDKLVAALPVVTQSALEAELAAMQKEDHDPDKGQMGFHALAHRDS